ncbi:MAG: type II toxin-antitoxin system HicB family antitoxin [Acidobacteria bacterium]|nr:type II toxin-antitoxin system HicB family antitoxin [Acidobacteriota bacterium]
MKYAVVYEKSSDGWGAYVPDLPGVGVVGDSLEEVEGLVREAVELHVQDLREQGHPVPVASATTGYIEVTAG